MTRHQKLLDKYGGELPDLKPKKITENQSVMADLCKQIIKYIGVVDYDLVSSLNNAQLHSFVELINGDKIFDLSKTKKELVKEIPSALRCLTKSKILDILNISNKIVKKKRGEYEKTMDR